jgi:hypothetical protein
MVHFDDIRTKKQHHLRLRLADSTRAKVFGLARVLNELNTYDIECTLNILLKLSFLLSLLIFKLSTLTK